MDVLLLSSGPYLTHLNISTSSPIFCVPASRSVRLTVQKRAIEPIFNGAKGVAHIFNFEKLPLVPVWIK